MGLGPEPQNQLIGYNDPFRRGNFTPERIDMGADFTGSGPIFFPGPGIVTEVDNSWLNAAGAPYPGTWIEEHFTSGPLRGKNVYFAEDITPAAGLHAGMKVDSNTLLGTLTGSQMETGYAANAISHGWTLAAKTGQYTGEGVATWYGKAWDNVLVTLGVKPARPQPSSISGSGPANWPYGAKPGPIQAVDTSFNPLGATSLLGSLFGGSLFSGNWQDSLERLGLILFGGLLVVLGVMMLANKGKLEVTNLVGGSGDKKQQQKPASKPEAETSADAT